MKYFTIEELTRTSTGLDNIPNEQELNNLEELIEILDGIREAWGSAIRVNSGFRSEEVNKAVGGSKTSAHRIGSAGDLEPVNGNMKAFQDFVPNYFKEHNIAFDQIIKEKPKNGIASWLHLGLKNSKGQQRGQVFALA